MTLDVVEVARATRGSSPRAPRGEQRLALLRVADGRDDDLVEQVGRGLDELAVPVVERVERARVEHGGHRVVLRRGRIGSVHARWSPPYCRRPSPSPPPARRRVDRRGPTRTPRRRRRGAVEQVVPAVEGVRRVEQGEVEPAGAVGERASASPTTTVARSGPSPAGRRGWPAARRAPPGRARRRCSGRAPRDSASMPRAPEPANRSSTVGALDGAEAPERVERRLPHPVRRRPGGRARGGDEPAAPQLPGDDAHAVRTVRSGAMDPLDRRGAHRPHRPAATCATPSTATTAERLHDEFLAFDADADAKVAVLTGDETAFCAGANLKDLPAPAPVRAARPDPPPAVEAGHRRRRGVVRGRRARAGGVVRPAGGGRRRPGSAASSGGGACRSIDGGTYRLPRIVGLGPRPRPDPHRPRGRRRRGRSASASSTGSSPTGPRSTPPSSSPATIAAFPWRCVVNDRRSRLRGPRPGPRRGARQRGPAGARHDLRRGVRRRRRPVHATATRPGDVARVRPARPDHLHRLRRRSARRLTEPPRARLAAGDLVVYRCRDCRDRWDLIVEDDETGDDAGLRA